MSTIPAKQIIKVLSTYVRVGGFSANGGSNDVTSAITTALSTAGDGGVSVPLQPSASNGLGVITTGANNRVEIYAATSKDKFLATNGEEVYGRLTEAGGVYTLTYYTLANTGVETAYTFAASTPIDFEFGYRFDFYRYPSDGAIGLKARNISDDPSAGGGSPYREKLAVTAQNTIADLAKTPLSSSLIELLVNGISYDSFSVAAFTLTGKALTWSATNAGFNIETTDRVIASYFTLE